MLGAFEPPEEPLPPGHQDTGWEESVLLKVLSLGGPGHGSLKVA
jgi:hypothetical protein